MVHGLAGLANAKENGWPMILVGGSSDSTLDGMMSFQESPQVQFATPYVKWAARFDSLERVPFYVEKAVRMATHGRGGGVYLDMPGEMVNQNPNQDKLVYPPIRGPAPLSLADPKEISKACQALCVCKAPLVIVGKGMQISHAEKEVSRFIESTGFPFIPSPMGKGLVPDSHPQNMIAARSLALELADVVILLGTRLNWMNHFGLPPRFSANVKIIQVDIHPEAFGDNVPSEACLLGHGPLVVEQLEQALFDPKSSFKPLTRKEEYWKKLKQKVKKNMEVASALASDAAVPMNYYHPITLIQNFLASNYPDAFIVSEGANTMDIGRSILENNLPRRRLDAATYGSMGPALGQAIAAQLVYPKTKVVCLLGDSSFGFSGMEIETICRYQMPIVIVIINNSGIAMGMPIQQADGQTIEQRVAGVPPTSLLGLEQAKYEMMAKAFGGEGYYITEPGQITLAMKKACQNKTMPSILNICISPTSGRRAQSHDWLSRSVDSKL